MTTPGFIHIPSMVGMLDEKGKLNPAWLQMHTRLAGLINLGYPPPVNNPSGTQVAQSVTIPIAGLTSLTFTNGILTGKT